MVEFVLIVPFLLIVLTGIIDFGFLFGDIISVRQGARDGGRQAAVGWFGSDSSCPLFGATGSDSAKKLMCLTKSRDNVSDERTRVRLIIGDGLDGPAYAVGNPITICEQYEMRSVTRVLPVLKNKVFTTRTVFRIETMSGLGLDSAVGSAVVVGEDSLPQGDWLKCSPP